ncbi:MAG: hypothetical protein ACR2FU_00075 [Streptosporangiaceae bacterium]
MRRSLLDITPVREGRLASSRARSPGHVTAGTASGQDGITITAAGKPSRDIKRHDASDYPLRASGR